jgi:hypothetical protein
MNGKLTQLAARRERLVAQAAAQRTALVQDLEPWRAPLALADRGMAALRYVRRHPGLLAGAALVIVALRPRRAGKWIRFAWIGWQFGRRAFRR